MIRITRQLLTFGTAILWFNHCYEIVTEESAEEGDFAENGFVVSGFDYPLEGCVGAEAMAFMSENGVEQTITFSDEGDWEDPIELKQLLLKAAGATINVNREL